MITQIDTYKTEILVQSFIINPINCFITDDTFRYSKLVSKVNRIIVNRVTDNIERILNYDQILKHLNKLCPALQLGIEKEEMPYE